MAVILPFRARAETSAFPSDWKRFARWLREHPEHLRTTNEEVFVSSMATCVGAPTARQLWWLDLIRVRYEQTDDPSTA